MIMKQKKGGDLVLYFLINSEVLLKQFAKWVDYRKEITKPLNQLMVDEQIEFLEQYDAKTACAIIKKSIRNGWQGLFEPDKKSKNGIPPEPDEKWFHEPENKNSRTEAIELWKSKGWKFVGDGPRKKWKKVAN